MSTLYLVRHAQASFLADDYDKLSSLGETQSLLLGGSWVNAGLTFDLAFVGPRRRHQETAQLCARVYHDAGLPWPEIETCQELDEYHGEQLLKRALPRLVTQDTHLQTLAAAFAESDQTGRREREKTFQKMFEHVMKAWARGEIEEAGVEPWLAFRRRVDGWVEQLQRRAGRGKRAVAFTSGGTIAAVVGKALRLDDEKTMEMSWMVNNSAITEFIFTEGRFTLSRFNALPHLDHAKLITYR